VSNWHGSRLVEAAERGTVVAGMMQTATVWFEREDGTRISWAGPFTMTESQRRAYCSQRVLDGC